MKCDQPHNLSYRSHDVMWVTYSALLHSSIWSLEYGPNVSASSSFAHLYSHITWSWVAPPPLLAPPPPLLADFLSSIASANRSSASSSGKSPNIWVKYFCSSAQHYKLQHITSNGWIGMLKINYMPACKKYHQNSVWTGFTTSWNTLINITW